MIQSVGCAGNTIKKLPDNLPSKTNSDTFFPTVFTRSSFDVDGVEENFARARPAFSIETLVALGTVLVSAAAWGRGLCTGLCEHVAYL